MSSAKEELKESYRAELKLRGRKYLEDQLSEAENLIKFWGNHINQTSAKMSIEAISEVLQEVGE